MPFSGGVYTAPSLPGSFNPAVEGSQATPANWNTLLADMSTALTTCITKNGQSTVTADIPMSGFKVTGLGAGTASGDSMSWSQVSATTVFLGADVALTATGSFFLGPSTGSVGAAGQVWLIMGTAIVTDTAGAANFVHQIYDATAGVGKVSGGSSTPGISSAAPCTLQWAGTLSAPTTFQLQCKDITSVSGVLLRSQNGATTANTATCITAVRLK